VLIAPVQSVFASSTNNLMHFRWPQVASFWASMRQSWLSLHSLSHASVASFYPAWALAVCGVLFAICLSVIDHV